MALVLTLADCSTNPALNGPDGSVDPPSMLDDQQRLALSFIAQLRDGASFPVGMVAVFAGTTAATGWTKINGALLSRTTYAALFAYASAQGLVTEAAWTAGSWGRFSEGDGSTTFRLPDFRSMFLQGLDESRGLDVGRLIGVYQAPDNQAHSHAVTDPSHTHGDGGHLHGGVTSGVGDHSHGYNNWAPPGAGAFSGATAVYAPTGGTTNPAGAHSHTITTDTRNVNIFYAYTGVSIQSQGSVARPRNLAYPFYIKY